jgi:hypothetical protein
MTICQHRWLRISLATLGILVAGAVYADRALAQTNVLCSATPNCATVTFNANVQITKLHPAVLAVAMFCTGPGLLALDDQPRPPSRREVVNRGYSGILTWAVGAVNLDNPANRTKEATCNLVLTTMGPNTQTDWRPAVVTTGPQQSVTASNWTSVGAGSVVTWTQTVTIPSANAAPQ